MDLAEELAGPLPEEYALQLQTKLNEGISVKRLAFGSEEDFSKFTLVDRASGSSYTLKHVSGGSYQRMLLVDKKELLFALDQDGKREFFYTNCPSIVGVFLSYFQKHLS